MRIKNQLQRCVPLLGTYVSISIEGNSSRKDLSNLCDNAFKKINELEARLSFHQTQSELNYLHQHAFKAPCLISSEMLDILRLSLYLSEQTKGAFDICSANTLIKHSLLPDTLSNAQAYDGNWQDIQLNISQNTVFFKRPLLMNLGGIAKGYIVDKAFEEIEEHTDQLIINASGDLRIKQWRNEQASIKHINQSSGEVVLKAVTMQASALASSAIYPHKENESRLINTKEKRVLTEARASSIFAPNCFYADALTKVGLLNLPNKKDLITKLGASEYVPHSHCFNPFKKAA